MELNILLKLKIKFKNISAKDFGTDRKTVTLDPEKHENNDSIRQQQKSGCC